MWIIKYWIIPTEKNYNIRAQWVQCSDYSTCHITTINQLLLHCLLTGDMSDPNLLLALFFSICSLWCTCQSSSSFLAFSLHSASAASDAESCRGATADTDGGEKGRRKELIYY